MWQPWQDVDGDWGDDDNEPLSQDWEEGKRIQAEQRARYHSFMSNFRRTSGDEETWHPIYGDQATVLQMHAHQSAQRSLQAAVLGPIYESLRLVDEDERPLFIEGRRKVPLSKRSWEPYCIEKIIGSRKKQCESSSASSGLSNPCESSSASSSNSKPSSAKTDDAENVPPNSQQQANDAHEGEEQKKKIPYLKSQRSTLISFTALIPRSEIT